MYDKMIKLVFHKRKNATAFCFRIVDNCPQIMHACGKEIQVKKQSKF